MERWRWRNQRCWRGTWKWWCRRWDHWGWRGWANGPSKNVGDFGECVKDGRSKEEWILYDFGGRGVGRRLEQVEHVFGCLLEIGVLGECREGNLLRKEVNFEDIALCHCVFEVAFPTAVMLKRWSDIPADLAVLAIGCACLGGSMCDDFGAWWGNGRPVKIEVAKK